MSAETSAVPCKVVPASRIAKKYTEEIKAQTAKMDHKLTLVGLLANGDPAAKMYASWTGKTANSLGFDYKLIEVPQKDLLEEEIYKANDSADVDGIIVYFPVFGDRQDQYLQQCVSIDKDVEGLNFKYVSNMYHNIRFLDQEHTKKSILPCTPLAVVKVLEYLGVYNTLLDYGNRLYGKTVTIVNRSEIVGRPLAALLANDGATVYSADINDIQIYERGDGLRLRQHHVTDCTKTLEQCAKGSDIIITGVPSKQYKFPTEYIKRGAVCINFSSEKNFDDEAVRKVASMYVPMIGKVTIAMLLRNLLRLRENRSE
ncbi:DEKNAAC102148 [Brettanomyces naardenensis]|uniref:Methylenetetrahydrofolate dehydrogenase [NAD(+)] n=1 Tax=Brettanomyces naardenensis TaxID=13370 RepID=A0A448YJU4_BRENA|nr:DEKNAAC102148 [Brettanomyces naardenensis]